MINIAHRGSNKLALENTFKAFDLAIEGGCQRIEFDVWRCMDDEFVVNHDANLERTTGFFGYASKLTKIQLQKIQTLDSQALPFLDEVINKYIDKVELNIEMKDYKESDGEQMGLFLSSLSSLSLSRIIVSSFNLQPLLGVKRKCPQVRLACLVGGHLDMKNLSTVQVLNFINELGTNIVHPYTGLINENFMDQAVNRKWLVFTYSGINDSEASEREKLWDRLKQFGVHGHCTNYPKEFSEWKQSWA